MNGNSTAAVVVEGGGEQVVAHVGLHALGAFADRLGLGDSLSARIPIIGERLPLHDRGKVLTQAMLMLAGGGDGCADIEHLRAQAELFGAVPSDSTLYRTFRSISADTLAGLWEAMAEVRARVWRRSSATTGTATVVLDIDSSLHQIHSENKQETAANYKGGFGFHPIYCFADTTGETLSVRLRPGNAGANNITDHVAVLDEAIAQLPEEIALGHRPGDDPSLVRRAIQVRVDSAGCTDFVWQARARNVGFAVVARSNAGIHAAISRVAFDDDAWQPALRQDGDQRPGAAVAELTELVDLSDWPEGTRLIVRREPLHPGAQQTLFPSTMFRYWGHYTDAEGDPVDLDVHIRAHAHVEDDIRRLKDSGAQRFPFIDIDANRAWLAVVCFADALVRWFQLLCLTGALAVAEPKTTVWCQRIHAELYQHGVAVPEGAIRTAATRSMLADGDLALSPAGRQRITVGYRMIDATDAEALPLKQELQRFGARQPACRARMIGYVCYVDRFAGTLAATQERLDYLAELGITYLHLMPLLRSRPGENDGGYAVMDYRSVEPGLGSLADLEGLARALHARGMSLCVDLVVNHTAREHRWARQAMDGSAEHRAYYHVFPDRTEPDRYEQTLREVFPDFAPGNFTWVPELDGWVWTTFHEFQWDLNYANPDVFAAMLDTILFLANHGVDVFRLDAVPFLWKRMGTDCENQPEAHALLQAFRALVRMAAPAVVFKAEAIVPPEQLVQYLGAHDVYRRECDLAYNNQLMVMLWSSLAARDARLATHALGRLRPAPGRPDGSRTFAATTTSAGP